jgi:predicted MFS family arabinose efflux permease
MPAPIAAKIHEPALGLVIRSVKADGDRLRALASVTVVAGLASTIFLPLMAFTVKRIGWRSTEIAIAAVVVVASGLVQRFVLPAFRVDPVSRAASDVAAPIARVRRPATFTVLSVVFVLTPCGGGPVLASLEQRGFHATEAVRRRALQLAGE